MIPPALSFVIRSTFAALAVTASLTPTARAETSPVKLLSSPEPGWPQFRGPKRDGTSDEKGLLGEWPEAGPVQLWSVENLGRGFSSPIIAQDKIFITGDVGEELHLFALDLQGKILWQAKNGLYWRDPYPGARSTITYSDGHLYHQNAHGRLACFSAETGKEVWAVEILEKFGGKNITWGLSECLAVDEQSVYTTAGGSQALLVALDKKTGAVRWQSAPLLDTEGDQSPENASYVSPILVEMAGRRLLIGCSIRHLYCADAATGVIQWTRRFPTTYSVISMMPELVNGDSIFMTAPHGKGGRLFRLKPPATADGKFDVDEVWQTKLDTLQGCVIEYGDKLVGSFYGGRKGWAAISSKTGEVVYDLPDTVKGAHLLADGRFYALFENGWMNLLEADAQQFTTKGRFRLAETTKNDAWAHPVIHQGRLYLRYHETLKCFDIRAKN